jgi:hypothetical protein
MSTQLSAQDECPKAHNSRVPAGSTRKFGTTPIAGNSKFNRQRGRCRAALPRFLAALLHPCAAALNQQRQNHHKQNTSDDPDNCWIHGMLSLLLFELSLSVHTGIGISVPAACPIVRGAWILLAELCRTAPLFPHAYFTRVRRRCTRKPSTMTNSAPAATRIIVEGSIYALPSNCPP